MARKEIVKMKNEKNKASCVKRLPEIFPQRDACLPGTAILSWPSYQSGTIASMESKPCINKAIAIAHSQRRREADC